MSFYRTLIASAFALGMATQAQAAPFEYDFNDFVDPAGTGLPDQDGWSMTQPNRFVADNARSHDGSISIHILYDRTNAMVHIRDQDFQIPDYANATTGVFGADLSSNDWGSNVGIGFDADGLTGGTQLALHIRFDDQRNQFMMRGAGFNDITIAANSVVPGTWIGTRMEIDFLANNGAGSGTMFVRDILNNGGWQVVSAMQNINLGLTPGSGTFLDPATWNTSFVSLNAGRNGIDNLFFDAQSAASVPAPGALALLGLGLIGIAARRRAA